MNIVFEIRQEQGPDGPYVINEQSLGNLPTFEDSEFSTIEEAFQALMEFRRNNHFYLCNAVVTFEDDSHLDIPF